MSSSILASLLVFAVSIYKSDIVKAASTITVNSTADSIADDGACTLREAIVAANNDAASGISANECAAGDGVDTIEFSIAPFDSSAKRITPLSGYPTITEEVVFDGSTQDDADCETHDLKIEVDASNVAFSLPVLSTYADNTVVKGMAFFGHIEGTYAVNYNDVDGGLAVCNNFGSNALGEDEYPGGSRSGSLGIESSDNITVGGDTAAERNVFANNTTQTAIGIVGTTGNSSTGNIITGNYFGTNIAGNAAMPNLQSDFSITSGSDNRVGGLTPGEGNLFLSSASSAFGSVLISNNDAVDQLSGTRVLGNTFGLDSDGSIGSGFGTGRSISVARPPGTSAINNVLIQGNTIRTSAYSIFMLDLGGASNQGVSVIGNTIYGASYGIEQCADTDFDFVCDVAVGPSSNDAGDVDTGPNNYMNTPEITSVLQTGNQISFTYSLDAADSPNDMYRLEFYSNDSADSFGLGQAQNFLGTVNVDLSGGAATDLTATFTLPYTTDITSKIFSATTTAIDSSATYGFGSTSEFGGLVEAAEIEYQAGTNTSTTNSDATPGSLATTGSGRTTLVLAAVVMFLMALTLMLRRSSLRG